jgi:hypothetical protein
VLMLAVGLAGLWWTRHPLATFRSRRYVFEIAAVAAFMLWFSERTWVHHYISFILTLMAAGMVLSGLATVGPHKVPGPLVPGLLRRHDRLGIRRRQDFRARWCGLGQGGRRVSLAIDDRDGGSSAGGGGAARSRRTWRSRHVGATSSSGSSARSRPRCCSRRRGRAPIVGGIDLTTYLAAAAAVRAR